MSRKLIPLFKVAMNKEIDERLIKTIHSGWIGEGPAVKEFESLLKKKIKNKNCVALSAGTHGISLALAMEGVGVGDEVISTPLSCFATNAPILATGANIVWADIDPDTLNISPESIASKVTNKTKAIIVVHWGGIPCNMKEIHHIASRYNVPIIEDAAHAFGSFYDGHPIGRCDYSKYCMMSFQAIKSLTTIDGGALFLSSESDCERARLLRWYGINRESKSINMRCENDILESGFKYHMNDVCATVGISNFNLAFENINKAIENAEYYTKALSGVLGIKLLKKRVEDKSSRWLFTILVDDLPGFTMKMGENNIVVSQVHARNDKHSCVKKFRTDLPNLESIVHKHISIPVGWWVSSADAEFIVDVIRKGW